jgi:hypothetical protein
MVRGELGSQPQSGAQLLAELLSVSRYQLLTASVLNSELQILIKVLEG